MYEKVVGVSGNRTTEAMSHCARQGGWYDIDTSKCMLFYTANQYCAKVKMDVSQIWVVDNTNGDIGCTLSSPYSQTTWAPTGYTQTISTENRPATTTVPPLFDTPCQRPFGCRKRAHERINGLWLLC
eukprot:TRINITY_DN1799_c0_g1_i1.p1 TRINITY_DN1799_c0_g1~~TRINITY_DN1799_c0_g1_i1.p1  ORF type:complete len:127 (+),score=8.70 TRINITY_DN1799_c0_g1_i1:58-438(+)